MCVCHMNKRLLTYLLPSLTECNRGLILGVFVPTNLLVIFTIKYLSTLRVSWKYMTWVSYVDNANFRRFWTDFYSAASFLLRLFIAQITTQVCSASPSPPPIFTAANHSAQAVRHLSPSPGGMRFVTFAHERSMRSITQSPLRHSPITSLVSAQQSTSLPNCDNDNRNFVRTVQQHCLVRISLDT